MNRIRLVIIAGSVCVLALSCQSAQDEHGATAEAEHHDSAHDWDYGPDRGPDQWASLSPDFIECAEGTHQSPINIVTSGVERGSQVTRDYMGSGLTISHNEAVVDLINNGHTIQITYEEGSTLSLRGKTYGLTQFHFHTPSEHTIDGRSFPMEMHLVHQADDGSLAVGAVLIVEGERHPIFDSIIADLPDVPGDAAHYEHVTIHIDDLIPGTQTAYNYSGSFSSPPCTEGVEWLVATEYVSLSADQLEAFSSRMGHNNRPLQPLGDRTILLLSVE